MLRKHRSMAMDGCPFSSASQFRHSTLGLLASLTDLGNCFDPLIEVCMTINRMYGTMRCSNEDCEH